MSMFGVGWLNRLCLTGIDLNLSDIVLLMHLILQIPFCVVIGWMMGQPMDLNFHLFETASLLMTVLVVAFLLQVLKSCTNIRRHLCLAFA